MKLQLITLIIIFSAGALSAQPQKRANRFPVGTFHHKNLNINGISAGLYSGVDDDSLRNVHTNGIQLEALGLGILAPLIPKSPVAEDSLQFRKIMSKPPSEVINGFNVSPAGMVCDYVTNGVSAGLIGQINRTVSGLSVSLFMNLAQRHNGMQVALFNESYTMNGFQIGVSNSGGEVRGLQIGLFNSSTNLKGLQLGLWNTNQKRKLPIVNWNF